MAVVMFMHWPEVTEEQYQQVRREVNWEGDVPQGAKFHVAWMAKDGFHVVDLWESPADFDRFSKERLPAGLAKAGVKGEPHVEFAQPLSVFAPNV
jgi:hypothetical protein